MLSLNRYAKINTKVLVILILVTVALGASLFAARQVRRDILSKMDLEAGEAAFENKDWPAAYRYFQEYLGRNPDDVEVLRKYAKARLAARPVEASNIMQAIAAYRRVMQLVPLDKIAYDQLTMLYASIGNFEELAYIARMRLEDDPNDREAPLLLADALIRLNKPEEAKQTLERLIKQLEALPDKYPEYAQACVLMSNIAISEGVIGAKVKALEWLDRALDYTSDSVEALANRARFYRVTANISGFSDEDRRARARKDLEAADALGTEDFRTLYFLGTEWMAYGELDKAEAELQAVENLPLEALEEHFLDVNDWMIARFLFASELATRKGNTEEGASLADEALTVLTEERHRVQIFPSAIRLYIAAGKISEARKCLDEYLNTQYTQEGTIESKLRLAYLRTLVADAEQKPYAVIDALQPVLPNDAADPAMWGFLARAYDRTGQTRRAVDALTEYLRYRPQDPQAMLQLANKYTKLGDWSKAYEAAQMAESLNPTDITCKLLRIEASINLAAGQGQRINTAKLEELSTELAQLRQEHLDQVDIRILQSIVAVYLRQPDEAESLLKQAIEECKEPLRAEMQLVSYYQRTQRIAEAISYCQAACERHSEVARPWLSLSELHTANADYDAARSCLRQGLDTVIVKEEKQSLSIRLALLELMQGDRSTGIRLLKELSEDKQEIRARSLLLFLREIKEDPTTAEKLVSELKQAEGETGLWWRFHQASLWLSSEEWRSKQQDITDLLQYCIDSDPQWSAPALLLVGMYERLEDPHRVEDTCRQALVRNPSATDIADRLLTLLERQGRFSEAEQVLQQIEADPRVASAWHVRIAMGEGNVSRAIDELKFRVSNNDQDANSRIQLARLLYQQTKDADQAFMYLKEAEAITPRSRTLTAVRSSILRAEGRTEEALKVLDDYVADHNDFDAYWMRAVYLTEEGEFERAEQDYQKLTAFDGQDVAGYMLLSNFYATNEKLDKAVATLEEGLKAYPDDLRLKRRLMQFLFQQAKTEDRERALEILAELEERMPQDPELMTIRAMQMIEESTPQSLSAAREKLENAVKLQPTAVNAHRALINMAMQAGEYETARDYAIRALGSNPDNPTLLSARGAAELALGNIQMALELSRMVIQRDPNNTEALSVLGEAAMSSGDTDLIEEARRLVKSAVGSDPMDEERLLWRAHVLAALERPRMAIPELEAYCQTTEGRDNVAALITLADLYRLSNDLEQARLWIDRAKQIEPNNQIVIHAQFLLLVMENKVEQLADISSAYISADKQNPTLVLRAASILSASDSMSLKKEAVKLFEHAVNLSPTMIDAHLGLASTLYQTGNTERAKKIYQELLGQYPNNIQILNDLAWILQEHDHRYADALELANKGLNLDPNNLHLLDTRGTILMCIPDRLADAKKDFESLIELSSLDAHRRAKSLLKLGRICVKLNDLDQAKQCLENALKIDRKMDIFTPDERLEINRMLQLNEI